MLQDLKPTVIKILSLIIINEDVMFRPKSLTGQKRVSVECHLSLKDTERCADKITLQSNEKAGVPSPRLGQQPSKW